MVIPLPEVPAAVHDDPEDLLGQVRRGARIELRDVAIDVLDLAKRGG
jgi:hypothetical protein